MWTVHTRVRGANSRLTESECGIGFTFLSSPTGRCSILEPQTRPIISQFRFRITNRPIPRPQCPSAAQIHRALEPARHWARATPAAVSTQSSVDIPALIRCPHDKPAANAASAQSAPVSGSTSCRTTCSTPGPAVQTYGKDPNGRLEPAQARNKHADGGRAASAGSGRRVEMRGSKEEGGSSTPP